MKPIIKNVICIAERGDIKKIDFFKKPGKMIITAEDGSTATYSYELVGVFK